MQRVSYIATLIIAAFCVFSCAKQNSAGPTGGPMDKTPPRVVEAMPPDKTVNFSEKGFTVTFDEYFVLDNVNQKLMISPPFDEKPEVSMKKKTLVVEFEEELRDSITYTFYFMDAIKDLNEGNPYENFQYVFSTGPTLDSLSVTGTIYNANTLDSGDEIFVCLYSNLSDTAPKTILPEYITRAGSDGRFRINNIATGEYAIYGLTDLNNNKIYDLPDETFAFIDSTIILTGSNNYIPEIPDSLAVASDSLMTAADSLLYFSIPGQEYSLYHFVAESKQQYLMSTSRDQAYKMSYVFKQPVDSGQFSLAFIDTLDVPYSIEYSPYRDTIVVWVLDSLAYKTPRLNVRTEYPETDSTGAIKIAVDTIGFRYTVQQRPARGRKRAVEKGLTVKHNIPSNTGFKPGMNIKFSFDTPAKEPDTSLIKLYMVDDTLLIPREYSVSRDSLSNKKFTLKHEFIPDSTYRLVYDKGAFEDIFGNVSDSTGLSFTINNSQSYGTLTMRLSGYKGNIILQLYSSDDRLIREDYVELEDVEEVYYPLMDKGEYYVKAIFDLDKNGEWTTGDYDNKIQPEPVAFYPAIIEIKVEWDLVQEWEITKLNYKDPLMRKEVKSSVN